MFPNPNVLKSKITSYHHSGIRFVAISKTLSAIHHVSHADTISEFSSNKQSVSLEHQAPIDPTFAFQDYYHTSLCRLHFSKSLRACQPPACERVEALKALRILVTPHLKGVERNVEFEPALLTYIRITLQPRENQSFRRREEKQLLRDSNTSQP